MIDRQVNINKKTITISQDLSLSHAGTIWDGALCLIAYLNKNHLVAEEFIRNKDVLELGSGTGILGLAASIFQPRLIYLTDLPQYLKLIQLNKDKNAKVIPVESIKVMPLQWGNLDHMKKIQEIQTIIGSQLAYDKGCIEQLMKTLNYYKENSKKIKIMISYQKYHEEGKNIEKQFKNYFGEQGYNLVKWSDMDFQYRDQSIGIIYVK